MVAAVNLDEVDWQILSILQIEARISFKELGQRIGLTGTAIAERVRKLEDEGIIEGYSIKLNRKKIGLPVVAFFKLRVQVEHCRRLQELAIALPEIIEAHRVVGNEYYILKGVLPSMQHLKALMEKFIQLGAVNVSIVLSTTVADKSIQKQSWNLNSDRLMLDLTLMNRNNANINSGLIAVIPIDCMATIPRSGWSRARAGITKVEKAKKTPATIPQPIVAVKVREKR
jgi:Lrp/AsnC family transcriptional regulator, leucine-responsive regulatory protein